MKHANIISAMEVFTRQKRGCGKSKMNREAEMMRQLVIRGPRNVFLRSLRMLSIVIITFGIDFIAKTGLKALCSTNYLRTFLSLDDGFGEIYSLLRDDFRKVRIEGAGDQNLGVSNTSLLHTEDKLQPK